MAFAPGITLVPGGSYNSSSNSVSYSFGGISDQRKLCSEFFDVVNPTKNVQQYVFKKRCKVHIDTWVSYSLSITYGTMATIRIKMKDEVVYEKHVSDSTTSASIPRIVQDIVFEVGDKIELSVGGFYYNSTLGVGSIRWESSANNLSYMLLVEL